MAAVDNRFWRTSRWFTRRNSVLIALLVSPQPEISSASDLADCASEMWAGKVGRDHHRVSPVNLSAMSKWIAGGYRTRA
jgi:hypothetical protein